MTMPDRGKKLPIPTPRVIDKATIIAQNTHYVDQYLAAYEAGDISREQLVGRLGLGLGVRKIANQELQLQSEIDPLTQLPNYKGTEKITKLLLNRGKPFGMVIVDLRHFGDINNNPEYGYEVGNQLLAQTAKRFEGTLYHDHAQDNDIVTLYDLNVAQDTPTRKHGEHGDEFLLFLPSVENKAQLEIVCKKLMLAFAAPFVINKNGNDIQIKLDISVGATIYNDGMSPESVADILSKEVSKVKSKSKEGGYAIFDIHKPTTRRSRAKHLQIVPQQAV